MVKLHLQVHKKNGLLHLFRCYALKDIDGSYYYGKVYAIDDNDDPVDVSHGYEYYFDVNETHNMLNWVNEEGYTRAAVRCEAYSVDDYHGAWFGGYWYPDI